MHEIFYGSWLYKHVTVGNCGFALFFLCRLEMKDLKGVNRMKCKKYECEEYLVERNCILCAYCDHSPLSHGKFLLLLKNCTCLSFHYDCQH
jgi:hypothetical protein